MKEFRLKLGKVNFVVFLLAERDSFWKYDSITVFLRVYCQLIRVKKTNKLRPVTSCPAKKATTIDFREQALSYSRVSHRKQVVPAKMSSNVVRVT